MTWPVINMDKQNSNISFSVNDSKHNFCFKQRESRESLKIDTTATAEAAVTDLTVNVIKQALLLLLLLLLKQRKRVVVWTTTVVEVIITAIWMMRKIATATVRAQK